MVRAFDCGIDKSPGSNPDRVIVLCSWARHLTLRMPLSIQEYNWVPENCQGKQDDMLGGYLGWTSIPSSNTPSRFMLRKPG